jgi:hypothetical protein
VGRADATAYRPARAAFDLVAILYLQLRAASLAAALGRAVNALAPGGTLLVVGHDITNRTHGYGGPQDPEVLYSPDQIASGLGGLVIDKAERVHRPVETDGGTVVAIDTLVRAHRIRPPSTAAPPTRTGA